MQRAKLLQRMSQKTQNLGSSRWCYRSGATHALHMFRELSLIAPSLSSRTPFFPAFFTRFYLQMHKDGSGNGSGLASLALTIRAMQKFLNHENQVITRRALDLCCCAPSKMWARAASILLVRIVGFNRMAAPTSFQSLKSLIYMRRFKTAGSSASSSSWSFSPLFSLRSSHPTSLAPSL